MKGVWVALLMLVALLGGSAAGYAIYLEYGRAHTAPDQTNHRASVEISVQRIVFAPEQEPTETENSTTSRSDTSLAITSASPNDQEAVDGDSQNELNE